MIFFLHITNNIFTFVVHYFKIEMLLFLISVESSSESTSRETTPESEGSDEEDENEDDLDEEVRNPFLSNLIHFDPFLSFFTHFDPI